MFKFIKLYCVYDVRCDCYKIVFSFFKKEDRVRVSKWD